MWLPNLEFHKQDEHQKGKTLHLSKHVEYWWENLMCWLRDETESSQFLMQESGTWGAHARSYKQDKDRDLCARPGPARLWLLSWVGRSRLVASCHPRALEPQQVLMDVDSCLFSPACYIQLTQWNSTDHACHISTLTCLQSHMLYLCVWKWWSFNHRTRILIFSRLICLDTYVRMHRIWKYHIMWWQEKC